MVGEKDYVKLRVNQFIMGNLHIEQMADTPLKTMPPKFTEVGKEVTVRILNVKADKRFVEFTKKDSLMKEDAPVFLSQRDVKIGDKIVGVVVSENNEFGYVVKTFGGIKGLLTFTEIQEKLGKNFDKTAFKVGSVVKAYVLFKKRDKGVALTLNKKKVKESKAEQPTETS